MFLASRLFISTGAFSPSPISCSARSISSKNWEASFFLERKEAMEAKSWDVLPMRVPIRASTAPRAPTESFPCAISRMAKIFAPAAARLATSPLGSPRKNTFRWLRFSFTTYSSVRTFHLP